MRPSDLSAALAALIPTRQPIFLSGPPGVGKSSLVYQAASAIYDGATLDSVVGGTPDVPWFVVVKAPDRDPVDLRGIPFVRDGATCWARPDLLDSMARSPAGGVLCIEELPQATAAVQCVLREILLDRRIGGHKIPDPWSVVATGNRQEDRAGATRLLSHVASACIQLPMEVSNEDWQTWALSAGIRPDIRSFLAFRPQLLHQFDPTRQLNPLPRTWEILSRVINCVADAHALPVATGCVGEGTAAEYLAFRRVWQQLPDPKTVLASADTCTIPTEPSVLYALTGALVECIRTLTGAAQDKALAGIVRLAGRLPKAFAVVLMRDSVAVAPRLLSLPVAGSWLREHRSLLLGEGSAA